MGPVGLVKLSGGGEVTNPDGFGSRETDPQNFVHNPVMVSEVLNYISMAPIGMVVDATVGLGGHAAQILEAISGSTLLGLDRDADALALAQTNLGKFEGRFRLVNQPFSAIAEEVTRAQTSGFASAGPVAILADLGVSSMQLDDSSRGFSIRNEGPLDMRMDRASDVSAERILNEASFDELFHLLRDQDEPHARRIAQAVVEHRPFATTTELALAIEKVVPYHMRRGRIHPATRTFQAIRIAVNSEGSELDRLLLDGIELLVQGGIFVVISYHSGEDRATKRAFLSASTGGCVCPKALGCVCGAVSLGEVLTRGAKLPTSAEISGNPRSRSARLRAFRRGGGS